MKAMTIKAIVQKMLLSAAMLMVLSAQASVHVTYYVNDALGSPILAMDEQGAVVWQESYQPYGQRQIKPAAANYDEQFYTGKQEEPDIGLQYYGARWYDPEAGRFTSIDPVGVDEGNIHSFNRYAYANNNPYRYIDPDGRAPSDPFKSPQDAAHDFGVNYNDDSIRNNVEYFSAIYSVKNKGKTTYSYNIPNKGNGSTVAMDLTLQPNQTLESTVHSHAAYDPNPNYSNNAPSPDDYLTMVGKNDEYVTTTNGSLIEYSANGSQKTISTDLPSDINDPGRLNSIGVGYSFFGLFDDKSK